MKTIVAYRSKSGYTERYARWIAEELGCDIKADAEYSDIADYDVIIYGGGMYAGGLNGSRLIKRNTDKLAGKHIVLFAVGSNPGREEELAAFWARLLNEEQLSAIPHFYLRGGFDYNKLGKADRILMNMLKKRLQSLKNPTEDERGMLEAYDNPVDFSAKENIEPLVACVRAMQQ